MVYKRGRALRDYLIRADEAARLAYVTENRIRTLAREGYIKPHRRNGFYRLGDVVDGHAEAVRMGEETRFHLTGIAMTATLAGYVRHAHTC